MTLSNILQQTAEMLSNNSIEDAHLEARVLLGHALKKSAVDLYTESAHNLSQQEIEYLQQLIERRLHREPTAYITNHKEFYGIDFYVDSRVLIPRPETELLVEEALKFAYSRIEDSTQSVRPLVAVDIGTGCGNIAISLALNIPNIKVYAIDISASALEVARLNCNRHNVIEQVILLQGNLLEPITEPVDIIVANLPYVTTSELATLSPEILRFEPMVALHGGKNGLDQINQLLRQANEKLHHPCCLLLEIGASQDQLVAALVREYLPHAAFRFAVDLNGIKRAIKINT